MHVKKVIYTLKQNPSNWSENFSSVVMQYGFTYFSLDHLVFTYQYDSDFCYSHSLCG